MTIKDILNYVITTPNNTNPSVLKSMLNSLEGGGGITPSGTISISTNGDYDVSAFASASVLVPSDSGDFSTAQVEIMGNGALLLPACVSDMGIAGITTNAFGDGASAIVPLWKGHLYCTSSSIIEVSGNAELIYEGVIDIYGDCIITLENN